MKEHLQEISDLFKLAEEKIKIVESLSGELAFPAINQLRYVAFHLLRAERDDADDTTKKEEYGKARNHCERAVYDASEIGITYSLDEIRNFQREYSMLVVSDVIPGYLEILQKVSAARRFIAATTKHSVGDHCNNRGDQYEKSSMVFEELQGSIEVLNSAKPELNKKIRRDRMAFIISAISVVLALASLIIALFK